MQQRSAKLIMKKCFFFKLGLTLYKAEQLQWAMELQEKDEQKDYIIQEICLERTCS